MMPIATRILAERKGFAMRDGRAGNQYQLIDNATGLPAVSKQSILWFSLAEANEFLLPLHDRIAGWAYRGSR